MNKLITVLVAFILLTACNQEAGQSSVVEKDSVAPRYFYFPKANVYIDSANNQFLFLATDGKTWQSAEQIPAAMQGLMDKNVFIENPTQPVWQDNESHRLVYSSLLYATANDTTKKVVPKPTVSAPKPVKDTVAAEKERKGLGKFFNKIFGKKKNKHKAEEEPKDQ